MAENTEASAPTTDKDANRRRAEQRVMPSTGTFFVSLPDLDWGPDGLLTHPPERVVNVHVCGDVTCLDVAKYDEAGGKTTTETVVEVAVSTQALLHALIAQLDPDVAHAALLTLPVTSPDRN